MDGDYIRWGVRPGRGHPVDESRLETGIGEYAEKSACYGQLVRWLKNTDR